MFGGRVELQGRGRSTAEIRGDSDGKIGLAKTGGQISYLLLTAIGVDIAKSLGLLLSQDRPVQIRCAVADFAMQTGDLKARTFVLDTTDTNITAEGDVNLGSEKLNLRLNAHPKVPSPLTARTPILIGGT